MEKACTTGGEVFLLQVQMIGTWHVLLMLVCPSVWHLFQLNCCLAVLLHSLIDPWGTFVCMNCRIERLWRDVWTGVTHKFTMTHYTAWRKLDPSTSQIIFISSVLSRPSSPNSRLMLSAGWNDWQSCLCQSEDQKFLIIHNHSWFHKSSLGPHVSWHRIVHLPFTENWLKLNK